MIIRKVTLTDEGQVNEDYPCYSSRTSQSPSEVRVTCCGGPNDGQTFVLNHNSDFRLYYLADNGDSFHTTVPPKSTPVPPVTDGATDTLPPTYALPTTDGSR